EPARAAAVDEAVVEARGGLVALARARLDARPLQAEAEGVGPQRRRAVEVGLEVLHERAGRARGREAPLERPPVGVHVVTLDLVPARGGAPQEWRAHAPRSFVVAARGQRAAARSARSSACVMTATATRPRRSPCAGALPRHQGSAGKGASPASA